jgi:EAL domain-containing protein (putative c-di-GMP-specific phosphodiesterase class I)
LDDFGSGLASFTHLKALPLDYVKIASHYVQGAVEDPIYGTLLSTVSEIGKLTGITTIADGVETEAVLDKVRTLGVGYVQGHAVAAPGPLVDVGGNVALPCIQRTA